MNNYLFKAGSMPPTTFESLPEAISPVLSKFKRF
jgi:hypothetical protein